MFLRYFISGDSVNSLHFCCFKLNLSIYFLHIFYIPLWELHSFPYLGGNYQLTWCHLSVRYWEVLLWPTRCLYLLDNSLSLWKDISWTMYLKEERETDGCLFVWWAWGLLAAETNQYLKPELMFFAFLLGHSITAVPSSHPQVFRMESVLYLLPILFFFSVLVYNTTTCHYFHGVYALFKHPLTLVSGLCAQKALNVQKHEYIHRTWSPNPEDLNSELKFHI